MLGVPKCTIQNFDRQDGFFRRTKDRALIPANGCSEPNFQPNREVFDRLNRKVRYKAATASRIFGRYVWYLPEDEFVDDAAPNIGHTNYGLLARVRLS